MAKLKNCHWLLPDIAEKERIASYLIFADLRRNPEIERLDVNLHIRGDIYEHPHITDAKRMLIKVTELSAVSNGTKYFFTVKSPEDGEFEVDLKETIEKFTNDF